MFSCEHLEQQLQLSKHQSVNTVDDIAYRGVTCK